MCEQAARFLLESERKFLFVPQSLVCPQSGAEIDGVIGRDRRGWVQAG